MAPFITRTLFILMSFIFMNVTAFSGQEVYDPLFISGKYETRVRDMTIHDEARKRDIPVRIYLTEKQEPAPVILFSHGLGGSREGSSYLGKHWSARGYVCVSLQHPGSDESVWKDVPPARRMAALQQAASARNLLLRVQDVRAVLDQLEKWNEQGDSPLKGRLDLKRVGMSGHSFGALTTQAVSGQVFVIGGREISYTEERIRAAVIFSPSSPRRGNPEQAFSRVKIPWILITGTKDVAVIGGADVESRLSVFPALPPGGKYELVLWNAEHSAFTDRPLPGDKEKRNPNHHRAVLAVTTAFWDAYLKGLPEALDWLNGSGPSSVLEPQDRWQKE